MKLLTLASMARSGRLAALVDVQRQLTPMYRLVFLSAAASQGILARLAAGPVPFDTLADEYACGGDTRDALQAWLRFGVRLGELRLRRDGYALCGRLARTLATAEHDAVAALVEEATTLHCALLREVPVRSRLGRRFRLADQDGRLIARSSRILEQVVFEAVDAAVPATGAPRLLEIGCGSGTYVRRAAARNPALTAVAVELQPEVADAARENLRGWGLSDRVTVEAVDIRERPLAPDFDLVTLHNNIYYFPVAERVPLFARLRGFLRPGGRLLLTTGCSGGSVTMEMLDLWAAATEGCGPLPGRDELCAQLAQAGLDEVQARRLVPSESYYSFVARNPG